MKLHMGVTGITETMQYLTFRLTLSGTGCGTGGGIGMAQPVPLSSTERGYKFVIVITDIQSYSEEM